MSLLRTVQLVVVDASRLTPVQCCLQALFSASCLKESLAHLANCGNAHLHSFGYVGISPRWTAFTSVCLEQDASMCLGSGGGFAGRNQLLEHFPLLRSEQHLV